MVHLPNGSRSITDGYNLLFTAQSPITIAPSLYPKLSFDPGRDLLPLAITQWTPLIVVSPKSLPADTLQELVALSASQPGKLFYASPGTGNELLDNDHVRKAFLGM